MKLGDVFKEIQVKHGEATEKGDMDALREVCDRYEELLNDAPNELVILFGLGTVKMQLGLNGSAMHWLHRALEVKETPEIWNNLGTAYKAEHRNATARECWEKAIAMKQDADYYNNMVTLYVNEGNPEEGLEWAEKGLRIDPTHARLHWNYSLLLLEMGRWRDGWQHYDYGIYSKDRPFRVYSNDPNEIPFWDGTPGKRIAVYGEQGMGDEIMFASCIPDLMKDCEVVFDCHPRMEALFRRSFGDSITYYPTRKENAIDWPKDEHLDAKVAIGSLFGFYRKDGEFPRVPYLKPDPELVAHYRKRLEATGPGPYVGIAWSAGVKKTHQHMRSLKLKAFEPIFKHGGTFISLQYTGESAGKVERYRADTGMVIHHWPEVVETGPNNGFVGYNFDHTVALIEALDLCILPNTTAVHVCGAIGKECWTFTPTAAAWRYQLSGDHMPMYGDWVTQFRGDGAMERLGEHYGSQYRRLSERAAARVDHREAASGG